jgi:hypothetical protein
LRNFFYRWKGSGIAKRLVSSANFSRAVSSR